MCFLKITYNFSILKAFYCILYIFLAPIPNVKIGNISSTSSEFIISFTGPLTKDVEGYTIRLASKKEKLQLSIPFSNVSYFDMVDLHPYRNYSVEVAMLYTGDEVGDFYSRRKFTTLEDRKLTFFAENCSLS